MVTGFLLLFLGLSLLLNLAFYLELRRVLSDQFNKKTKEDKIGNSVADSVDTKVFSKIPDSLIVPLVNRPWSLPSLVPNRTPETKFGRSQLQYPPVITTLTSGEILQESPNLLVNWLNKSLTGLLFIKDPELPLFLLNSIVLDIETSETQLLIGFYFTSLNVFVQFLIDTNDSIQIKQSLQTMLRNFFIELSTVEKNFSTELQTVEDLYSTPLVFTFLSGYNINNYDFPVIDKFLQTNPAKGDPVKARATAKELLTIRDRSDFSNFSPVLSGFFFVDVFFRTSGRLFVDVFFRTSGRLFVDVFFRTSGRLKDWISILNPSQEFNSLSIKKWDQPQSGRVDAMNHYNWFVYNRNDLLATHYLGIFQNNYLNYILQRFSFAKLNNSETNLINVMRQRFLK